jgi:hypothetical protein
MIVCFHPPKNAKELTIRGSGAQEDASTGIWGIEKVADGIQLEINRAKGPGEGNWRKFKLQTIPVGGVDQHGKPLEGVVPIKIAGTEDEGSPEYEEAIKDERRAWAEAVKGVLEFPAENNKYKHVTPNVKQVAEFLQNVWVNRDRDDEAADFVKRYMMTLQTIGQTQFTTASVKPISNKLDKHFMHATNLTPVRFQDGSELRVAAAESGKRKHFYIVQSTKKDVK